MKLLFCLLGAAIGGFPGALLAFFYAVAIGGGEVVCCIVNLELGVIGAVLGVVAERAIRGQRNIRIVDVILPLVLGLICGIIGYEWLNWAISNADPPL